MVQYTFVVSIDNLTNVPASLLVSVDIVAISKPKSLPLLDDGRISKEKYLWRDLSF